MARRRADARWSRWGVLVFLGVESIHVGLATLVNEWEGWGGFFSVLSFAVVSGLVIVGLTYGLLVRWGLRPSPQGRNHAGLAGLAAGLVSAASYAIFFVWAPFLIAPAAVLLAREGIARGRPGSTGRGYAISGGLLGLATLAFGFFMIIYLLVTHFVRGQGEYPFGF